MHLYQKVKKVVLFLSLMTVMECAYGKVELLDVDIFPYESFAKKEPGTLVAMKKALLEKGIVGLRAVPGYKESAHSFIESARKFSSLPSSIKLSYSPNRERGEFTGYEIGKEKFQRPNGTWMVDDSKASYYALIPNTIENRWPQECDLQTPFENIAELMLKVGKEVLFAIDLIGPHSSISSSEIKGVGRMLHYAKQTEGDGGNPFWCGAHFDHSLFTVLMPAFYFVNGNPTKEPEEAGLFVRVSEGEEFKKVVSDDPDVVLFQVGEFGQLVSNDAVKATEHRVHKALGGIERYTMALFLAPDMQSKIESTSILTKDARYGKEPTCTYQHWHEASLSRYLVKE